MPIWDKEHETLPREELKQLQLERLQAMLNRVYRNVNFYRNLFEEAKITPGEIMSLDELAKIPFTTKETLRANQPYGMFALPLREVVRLQTSSGTTGEPSIVGYTKNDIEHWTELIARVLTASGVTKDDVVQIAFDYGLFTGALGFHYGAEHIGATVIPCSRVSAQKQNDIMRYYRTTVLLCTPNFALQIAEALKKSSINPAELSIRIGLFGAEPWTENMRQKIEETLHITAFDNYGISEIIGPGVSVECEYKNGLHIMEDHFIPEVINPDTGKVLPDGEKGELVLTTVTKEAFPLVRYRTGDLTSLTHETCQCGRTFARMSRIMERTDDMIVIQGVNVFPSDIKKIIAQVEGTEPHCRLSVSREEVPETLQIDVEISEMIPFDEMGKLVDLRKEIENRVEDISGVPVRVKLVEPRTISSSSEQSYH